MLTAFGEDLQGNLGPCSGALISCSFPGGNSATLWDACVRPLFFFFASFQIRGPDNFCSNQDVFESKVLFS